MYEHTIQGIPEKKLFGTQVISSEAVPEVTVRQVREETGAVLYSVESGLLLDRNAVNAALRLPLEDEGDWGELRTELRHLGYFGRTLRRIGSQARIGAHLQDIRGASSQLADTLTRNQSEQRTTVFLPTYTYHESIQAALHQLERMDTAKLLLQLKGIGYDIRKARYFNALSGPYTGDSPFSTDELQSLAASMGTIEREIVNGAILQEAEGTTFHELLHRTHYGIFTSFGVRGDTIPPEEVYLETTKIPEGTPLFRTEVTVGAAHRTPDKLGRERRRITFHSEQDAVYARPLLMWRREPEGERTLRFPGRGFDVRGEYSREHVTRPSSIVGAAMAATALGHTIDYRAAFSSLYDRVKNAHHLDRAYCWPVVADYQQAALLDTPYVRAVETFLDASEGVY